jgi:hypothetical protein
LAGDHASGIAQLEFCLPSKSFGTPAAAIIERAAVQRGWRDFRMAITSCDRNDAPLPKIWTLASLRAHEREQWRRQ